MPRRAAIAATVAAACAASASTLAQADPGPARLTPQALAGFCIPAPDTPDAVASAVNALGVPLVPTRPIAVLDTGVDPDVAELQGRVLPGFDALGAGVTADGDGHGTQVAALAAGVPGRLRGVSPASKVIPIRVANPDGVTTVDPLVRGINAAVQRGAGTIVITSAAKAAETPTADLAKLNRAIGDAFTKGVLVVAAAGDDGDGTPTIPAGLPHVLTAGGAGAGGLRAPFSNRGPWIDLVAPSEGLFSPLPGSLCVYGYGSATGTSYAAAVVAGAAAAVAAARPELTTQQRFELLRRATVDVPPGGRDHDTGYGMLDVGAALTAAAPDKDTYGEVDDDPFWFRRTYAKKRPALLRRTLRFRANGAVNPAEDPADVYPVHLKKGERLVVSVTAVDTAALLELSILSPTAGDFDIANGAGRERLDGTGGVTDQPDGEIRAKVAGTHFIAVETTDATDADDPEAVPPDTQPYRISAYKQRAPKTAKKRQR